MPLVMEVGLGPDDIVLDGDPAPPPSPKRGRSPLPNFQPMFIAAKRLDRSRWHLAWRWALVTPGHVHCARWGPSSPAQKGVEPPIFGPFLLWPNSWIHQDATWYGRRPQPRQLCVRWEPNPTLHKKGGAPSPIFGPFLFWPNGWMHQDATWYGGRPRLTRWDPAPLP